MRVQVTSAIEQLCREARDDEALPEEARISARNAAGQASIEWDALKEIVAVVRRQRGKGETPLLYELCRGGGVSLRPPPPRPQGKSPELQAHLDRLRRKLEQDQYDAMVADVTVPERAAAAASEGGLRTYRQQMSFGLHVIVMMGTFYMFGHLAGMAITTNRRYHPAVGLAFMVFAMVLETILFVIRTTVPQLHYEVEQRGQRARQARSAAAAPPAAAKSQVTTDRGMEVTAEQRDLHKKDD